MFTLANFKRAKLYFKRNTLYIYFILFRWMRAVKCIPKININTKRPKRKCLFEVIMKKNKSKLFWDTKYFIRQFNLNWKSQSNFGTLISGPTYISLRHETIKSITCFCDTFKAGCISSSLRKCKHIYEEGLITPSL